MDAVGIRYQGFAGGQLKNSEISIRVVFVLSMSRFFHTAEVDRLSILISQEVFDLDRIHISSFSSIRLLGYALLCRYISFWTLRLQD